MMKFPEAGNQGWKARNGNWGGTRQGVGEVGWVRSSYKATCCIGALLVFALTAIVAGQQTTTAHPNPSSSPLAEAQSAIAEGNATKAIAILTNYLWMHPSAIPAHLALGQAYAAEGQTEQARGEFQTVLKSAPNNVTALTSLSDIYLHAGALDKAEVILGRAVKASDGAPRIRMQWALVLARLHKYQEAQKALGGLTPPGTTEARIGFYRLQASVASGLGNSGAAAAEMEKAFALQPQDAGLTVATALAELQSENFNRAASVIEPLYSRTHDPQSSLILLQAQLGMHADVHRTLDSLRVTELQSGEELAFRQQVAEVLVAHGEFSAAVEELKRTVKLDPSRADLAYNLALAQLKGGQLDDSLQSAEKCRALGDTADVEDLLGDIHEARGDNLAAVRSYQAAVSLAPREEKYRLSLAVEFILHKSFDPARVVLKQAEELWPRSWRVQLASGMVEYFTGSYDEASRILMRAAKLAPEPEMALRYLGDIQMDQASPPAPDVISDLCGYSDQHSKSARLQYYCGGLQFRRDYGSGDKTHASEILRRLQLSASLDGKDPAPHCLLGKVYRWLDKWQEARAESETCVHLEPNSADGHYRLAQIYQHLGESEGSRQEMDLYKSASQRMADENARRDETIKTFLYTIQNEAPDHK
jgi:tetratricopeptide (TPR) repeat protein